jgi:PAS domain S-box-containing protein
MPAEPIPAAAVLLVDDDPANLLAMEAALAAPGRAFVRADSGEEALRRLLERDFAVVLLDLALPGLDGFETARLLRSRERSRDTPVIFVTGRDTAAFPVAEAYRLGAVDYLLKPVVPEVLRAKVDAFVDLYRKSERLRELERQRSESLLRQVWEGATDGLRLTDRDGTVRLVNAAFCRLVGRRRGELEGRPMADVYDEAGRAEVLRKHRERFAARAARPHSEAEVALWDGRRRWFEASNAFLDVPGEPPLLLSAFRDVTERHEAGEALRASEARFRRLFDAGVIGLNVADTRGHIAVANDEYLRIVGHSREEFEAGRVRWTDLTPPEWLPADAGAIAEAQERGACTPYEKQYLRRDGSRVWVLVGFVMLDPQAGEVVAFVLDLTRQKAAEESLREADRRKDEFLAMLGHELRNPLAPIRNAVAILRRFEAADPAQPWALAAIDRQVRLLSRLTDDLLDVARLTRGRLELRRERVELGAALRDAVEAGGPLAEAAGHTLAVSPPGGAVYLDADPVRLAQVFGNLLSNAVKYTEPGGRIDVSAGREGGEAVVRVRGTGVGMSREVLARAFEPFAQGDQPLHRSKGGLGVGLTLVRRLAELHGGSVEAWSEGEGKGSEFVVRLPLAGPSAAG